MRRAASVLGLCLSACTPLGPSLTSGAETGTGSSGDASAPDEAGDITTPITGEPVPDTSDGGEPGTSDIGEGDTIICEQVVFNSDLLRPNVMLVLDKSGSMVSIPGGFWDHDGDDADDDGLVDGSPNTAATERITRWASLHAVVESFVVAREDSVQLGAVLFPSTAAKAQYSEAACPVAAAPEAKVAAHNAATILAAIPGADDTDLDGATPTAAAFTVAVNELAGLDDGAPRFIILITDGAANCAADAPDNAGLFEVYDEQLPALVGQALADGIPTAVLGIAVADELSSNAKDGNPDLINPRAKLVEVAQAGGLAQQFVAADDELELASALTAIGDGFLSCTTAFGPLPLELLHEIQIGDHHYGPFPVDDCASEDGWRFVDAEQTTIELCGPACEAFRTSGRAEIVYAPC